MKKLIQQTYILLTFLLFMWQGTSVNAQCNHPDDYTALRALYLATDGDNWTIKTGWPTRAEFLANPTPPVGTDMSGWLGIQCTNTTVITVVLKKNNLIGTLPNLNLKDLIVLNLAENKLQGFIPNFDLPNLQWLALNNNEFSGEVPDLKLAKLMDLNLSMNQILGIIPKLNLKELRILNLSFNKLSGNIPNFDLPNLGWLYLNFNQLSGEIPNLTLTKLTQLNLSRNQLTGNIPNFLFSDVTIIDLSDNQLNGSIPNFNLPNLEKLILTRNQLTGNIPNFILPKLLSLDCGGNQLTGITNFNLPNLQILNLESNQIIGSIPNFNLPNLQDLFLGKNKITGSVPNFNLPKLRSLQLYENQLTGTIPNFNLPLLIYLNFNKNNLSGKIPSLNLPKLHSLQLTNNKFNGELPDLSLPNIQTINLWYNNLNGCIPFSFKKYCDSIVIDDINNIGFKIKVKPEIYLFSNPLLPWQGDFNQFCATDGIQQAQIGAPCENGNPADGANDVIQDDCSCGLLPPCNHPDYAPIMELYNSTNGPNWINNAGWADGAAGTNCDPCNGWYGVKCENDRVKYIDLDGNVNFGGYQPIQPNGNNLTGFLNIGKMDSLIFLDLNFNKIGDSIPGHFFQNLKNLKSLSVAVNQITGSIPKEISEMNKIENINLVFNQISGFIPKEIGDLNSLKYLQLSFNRIVGTIPEEIGNLENLEYLALNQNKLTGEIPTEFKSLKKLVQIELSVNELSGEIPKELAELPKLKYLFLAYNRFTGNVHNNFFYSDSLKLFSAPYNNLSGCFNDTIYYKFCENLNVTLNLNNNPLLPWQGDFSQFCAVQGNQQEQLGAPCDNGNPADGTNDVIQTDCSCGLLPPCTHPDFDALMELYDSTNGQGWTNKTGWEDGAAGINCDPCNFNGSPWYGIQCKNSRVASLNLNNNQLNGSIPNFNLPNLQNLSLPNNQLNGSIPNFNLPNLEGLSLYNNQLKDTIPNFNLPSLQVLSISDNQLTGSIPNFNLPNLWSLSISNNGLTGSIPNFNLPILYDLSLSNNQLTGSIPNFNLPSLRVLSISDNQLTGSIPNFNLPNLYELSLSNNQLTGSIPYFTLPNLTYLILHNNQLSGVIPNFNLPNFGMLADTCDVILSNNRLSGCFPIELKNFCNRTFYTDNNPLLPWQGDFSQFCATDGSQQAQIGAPCNNGNPGDGTNDVIDQNCNCEPCPTIIATITGTNFVCQGESATFTAIGGASYIWSNGATTADITVYTAGTYSVTVINANGCEAKGERILNITANPVAAIIGANEICEGSSTEFTATGGASYVWNTAETTDKITVNTAGSYSVTVNDVNGCTSSTNKTLAVTNAPTATITGTNAVCQGESATFTAVGGTSYIWSNGATTADIIINTAGTYSVTVTDANNCEATGEGTLTINANPTATIFGANEICEGSSTEFTATGGVSYIWNTAAPTNKITVNTAGIYIVTVTDANGCTSENTKTLAVTNAPSATITGINAVCPGESTTFTATGGASYLWSNGATTADIIVNVPGTYSLTVTNIQGCYSTGSTILTLSNTPTAEITGVNEICEGESKILTASGGSKYLWNTGSTNNAIQINSGGIYTVSVTNNNGCDGSTSFRVTLLDDTTMSQTKNDTLYVDQGSSYQVDMLQNDILFTDSIKVQLVNIPQAFIRVLSFDEKGRISLEVKEAFIETLEIGYEICDPCNPCVSGKLIILNEKLKEITQTTLITPSQSTNNTLQFSSEPIPDSELWIYNRWGQQIFHSKNYQNDWDASGYPGGVYYYVFKVYGFTIKRALTVVK